MISVIVCTYNREQFLPDCLKSLANQTLSKSKYEIVIIDNNCTDSTETICKEFIASNPSLTIQYHIEENQGLSYSRNRGIVEAKGEVVTFIDDDAKAANDFLEVSYNYLKNNKQVSIVGGKILLYYEAEKPVWLSIYLASLFGYFNLGDSEKTFVNSYPRGSNMTFKKELFKKYKTFNTELGRKGSQLEGGEEKDLIKRMLTGGELIKYIPQAIVYHAVPVNRTSVEFIKKQAIGVGSSERNRMENELTFGYIRFIVKELFKWIATIFISMIYTIKGEFQKAKMLVKFRSWVTLGGLKL